MKQLIFRPTIHSSLQLKD